MLLPHALPIASKCVMSCLQACDAECPAPLPVLLVGCQAALSQPPPAPPARPPPPHTHTRLPPHPSPHSCAMSWARSDEADRLAKGGNRRTRRAAVRFATGPNECAAARCARGPNEVTQVPGDARAVGVWMGVAGAAPIPQGRLQRIIGGHPLWHRVQGGMSYLLMVAYNGWRETAAACACNLSSYIGGRLGEATTACAAQLRCHSCTRAGAVREDLRPFRMISVTRPYCVVTHSSEG